MSVASRHGSGHPNSVIIAVIDRNGNRLVKEPKIAFHTHGLMITLCSGMTTDLQEAAHGLKDGEKTAAGVDHHHPTHTKF
jgi:hypothetical protein